MKTQELAKRPPTHRMRKLGGAVLLAAPLLGGCGLLDVAALRDAEPEGTPFQVALSNEYRLFAVYEADEMRDWIDAGHFARKGLAASRGRSVAPEPLAQWRLPRGTVLDLARARRRLVAFLDAGAREKRPQAAARAQASFDCWVEQQEENWQTEHIAACRDSFHAALDRIDKTVTPRAVVHFAFDSAEIDAAGRAATRKLVRDLDRFGGAALLVDGHADRAGPDPHNRVLSRARAIEVWRELVFAGIPRARIAIRASGEDTPLVATKDGVREPRNRRAEITVRLDPITEGGGKKTRDSQSEAALVADLMALKFTDPVPPGNAAR